MGGAGAHRRGLSELRTCSYAWLFGRAASAKPVRHVSYSLRRAFWFVWRWQTDYNWGLQSDTGLSLGRGAAQRKARTRLGEGRRAIETGAARLPTTAAALEMEGRQSSDPPGSENNQRRWREIRRCCLTRLGRQCAAQ